MTAIVEQPAVEAPHGDITVRGVSKVFQPKGRREPVHALAPVDLTIEQGSFVSVVGRSGCGKSTLLRIMAGLTEPTTGEVGIGRATVTKPHPLTRYLFQDYSSSLLAWKTVAKNVEFGIRHGGDPKAEGPEHFLDLVGLHGVGSRYPGELSGGMQQRVAIARALASGANILLLDEPFSAVDALSRATLQDLVQNVWREFGLTVVFVTHDIDEAIYLADRVVVLAPRGAGVQEDLHVDLPRPRAQLGTRESPEFLHLRRRLADLLLGAES